jgi:hypothetical protein
MGMGSVENKKILDTSLYVWDLLCAFRFELSRSERFPQDQLCALHNLALAVRGILHKTLISRGFLVLWKAEQKSLHFKNKYLSLLNWLQSSVGVKKPEEIIGD